MQNNIFINRIKKRIALEKKLAYIHFYSKGKIFHENDALIICGDPRGGSTWLAESLAELPKTTLFWEPLHLSYSNYFRSIGFDWRQYIPVNGEWEKAKKGFSSILQGKVLNEWTLLKTSPGKYKKADKLLVKFCRANALLPWLCENYIFKYKPVYLVRHPLAVVASQLKQGGWGFSFSEFEIPNGRFSDYYLEHELFLKTIKTKEEALIASWCLSNKNILSISKDNRRWIQIHYENMLCTPEKSIKDILEEWDLPCTSNIMNKLASKSSTTIQLSPIHNKNLQLSQWQKHFSSPELYRMQKILDYFKISTYSVDDIMPVFR